MTDKPSNVRLATEKDEGALYDLLVALHRNNEFGWGYPYRPEIVLARIECGTRPKPETRTNPQDKRRGIIGVIDGDGELAGSVGLFIEEATWFTDAPCLVELWLFVRPEARDRRAHERSLFDYARWAHARLKEGNGPDYPLPFPLHTGFMHNGKRYEAMERLWRRRSGGRKIGTLFLVD